MSWSSQRKFTYGILVISAIIIAVAIPAYLYFNKTPTCIDSRQNGDEDGVDCGGSCSNLCSFQIDNPVVHWSRPFKIVKGVYDVVAFVENPNFKAGVDRVIYKFKLYDENNILVAEKLGRTFIRPNEQFAVFESGIRTGERIPKRTFFEFEPDIQWSRIEISDTDTPNVFARDKSISDLETKPRLRALLVNDAFFEVKDIEVTVILYDINDNAIAVSSTVVDSIKKNSTRNVTFTWNEPFTAFPTKIEILPRVDLSKLLK